MTFDELIDKRVNELKVAMTPDDRLNAVLAEMDEIRVKIKPLNDRWAVLVEQKRTLREMVDDNKLAALGSKSFEEQAEFFLDAKNDSGVVYQARRKFFNDLGVSADNYHPDTNQHIVRIAMDEDHANLDKVCEAILKLKPLIKPVPEGCLYFDIFEHTCSEFDSYCLIYDDTDKYWTVYTDRNWRSGRNPKFMHESLRKTLAYICKEIYYTPCGEENY